MKEWFVSVLLLLLCYPYSTKTLTYSLYKKNEKNGVQKNSEGKCVYFLMKIIMLAVVFDCEGNFIPYRGGLFFYSNESEPKEYKRGCCRCKLQGLMRVQCKVTLPRIAI